MSKLFCPICKSSFQVEVLEKGKFTLYICKNCGNGFVSPVPKNMERYYPALYWQYQGIFSKFRKWLHYSFQKKRIGYLKGYLSKGEILDVGSGEGVFGKLLCPKFKITNLEYPGAKIENNNIIKADFLKWHVRKKFDAIFFLESLEHVAYPQQYLVKARKLLKDNGYIFVEYPRFNCFESKILGEHWLQRDIPRHLFHFTDRGLAKIARRVNLKAVAQKCVLSYEYSPYCLLVSVMNILKIRPLNLRKGLTYNIPTFLFLAVFSPISFLAETILYFFNQSPTGLMVLKKKI